MLSNHTKKQLAAFIILAVLVTGILSGCSNKDTPATAGGGIQLPPKSDPAVADAKEDPEKIRNEAREAGANELGAVPILVYHLIGEKEGRWTRTPENFRRDLEELYNRNYVLIPLNDYLSGDIDIPAGKSPAIITFDDSSLGQFRLLEEQDSTEVDPNSAVGILRDFGSKHKGFGHAATFFINAQPFGQPGLWQKKLKLLDEWGFEIGNHTYGHKNLGGLTPEQVADEIVRLQDHINQAVPGYETKSFAIVQDGMPKSYDSLLSGSKDGKEYNHTGVLMWAWSAAKSPFHKDYDPKRIQRIQVFQDNGKSSLVNWLERITAKRYVSDGKKDTIALPEGWEESLGTISGKTTVIYQPENANRTPGQEKQASRAKGIHVTFSYASSQDRRDEIINLIEKENLNTVQLDVKDESGRIGYLSEVKLAKETGSGRKMVPIREYLTQLKEQDIYTIARIVVFRDPFLARAKPGLRVVKQDGSPVLKGEWVSPYSREVWEYNISLAREAYDLGFDEVQFDYIRFPENARTANYAENDGRHRVEVISDFLSYARQELGWDKIMSATVFGFTGFAVDDMGIGQRPEQLAPYIDYISPMVYPSHYSKGNYGFPNPNAHPYEVVDGSLKDINSLVESSGCRLRPWLQAFSLGRPPYGKKEIVAQIKSTEDNGINTWLLWSPIVKYPDNLLSAP
ncbi:MAG: hypothetical protein CVU89_04365 [Firmicutes bacterium HGW-Firmicutes-14]|nr:MAG: hypothetical protein CVU89_04365 [Firmicutes bacterium HGW-Firmicutes-14]